MATNSEQSFFSSIINKQTKYGSTSKNLQKPEKIVTHKVMQSDTLQGLALRYGTTMEHIKRANNLWTNDTIFLRDTLQIPVPSERAPSQGGGGGWHRSESFAGCASASSRMQPAASDPVRDMLTQLTFDDPGAAPDNAAPLIDFSDDTTSLMRPPQQPPHAGVPSCVDGTEDERRTRRKRSKEKDTDGATLPPASGKERTNDHHLRRGSTPGSAASSNAEDFLSRFDANIAAVKSNVKRLEKNSTVAETEWSAGFGGSGTSTRAAAKAYNNQGHSLASAPHAGVVQRPSKKHVKNTLNKLPQDGHDDIFEL